MNGVEQTGFDAEGVVGDVCTVFLRADGTYRDIALNERATGPAPEELRRVPRIRLVLETLAAALEEALRG